jgi:NAD(P) transhydrogenase subunit beta
LTLAALGAGIAVIARVENQLILLIVILAALGIGILMVLPIGGADMPVVISLLNAFTGTAVAMAGFVLENATLTIAGALVGASGGILTKLMADAMNRSVLSIIAGGFGTGATGVDVGPGGGSGSVKSIAVDDVALQLAYASKVIIVPGYGLAAAQAQHEVRELATQLEDRGVEVSYAIHPVAGRMPGHMNVLLAEANVPYDQLREMDDINPEFDRTDVALVIGANDVTNPAARRAGNAVSGMPILDVDHARSIIVLKRSMASGYAGIDNELYTDPKTSMYFADAKKGLATLVQAVKQVMA